MKPSGYTDAGAVLTYFVLFVEGADNASYARAVARQTILHTLAS